MPVLDYKEISQANISSGSQDQFEQLARDFFHLLGFSVVDGPDRGQDGGRDLIVVEKREGIIGVSEIIWLVSCKHKAHSGKAVLDSDEQDITDRVGANGAIGFIGCYSTLPSAPLQRKINGLKMENKVFDGELIEAILLDSSKGRDIAKRYFPVSYCKWEVNHQSPANLFDKYKPLVCCYCGKDLLSEKTGIIAFVEDIDSGESSNKIIDIYWACKGDCDDILENRYIKKGLITEWEDISDIIIPYKYLKWNIAIMNRLRDKDDDYDQKAFEKLKEFIIGISQLALRNQSDDDIKRIKLLAMFEY